MNVGMIRPDEAAPLYYDMNMELLFCCETDMGIKFGVTTLRDLSRQLVKYQNVPTGWESSLGIQIYSYRDYSLKGKKYIKGKFHSTKDIIPDSVELRNYIAQNFIDATLAVQMSREFRCEFDRNRSR
ncbi:hypothetical protein F4X88_12810 [Candidatus Poribacteria bacterium]|nr:hypothetical protein [Candidatus Poribacteria bacterium]